MAVGGREAEVAPGDLEARRKTFDVPLPRAGEGLIEVVDVEEHLALGRGEDAEVEQVGVAAELHVETGDRSPGEVGRHDEGGAPVEGRGRDEHAAVADGDKLGDAALRLLLQQRHGVRAVGRRPPPCIARARRIPTCGLAPPGPLRCADELVGARTTSGRTHRRPPLMDVGPLLPGWAHGDALGRARESRRANDSFARPS